MIVVSDAGLMSARGVYGIRNLATSTVYIGSTMRTFHQRYAEHCRLLRTGRHWSYRLQSSWNKHSEDAFVFEILRPMTTNRLPSIIRAEQREIDKVRDSGYKVFNSKIAEKGTSTKHRPATLESIERMLDRYMPIPL